MSSQKEVANPRTTEFEFMGPYVGPSGIILGLPILVWAFAALCSPAGWPIIPSAKVLTDLVQSSFSWNAMGVYVAWWLFQAALYLTVPGRVIPGVKLRDGSHLMYNINGLVHVFVHPITWICDNYLQLTVASIIFSVVLSVYLYASSFARGKMLALGGNSGIPLYDFFIGRELNPRVLGGKLDLKYFCELRPGLFLWLVINTAMLIRHYETTGTIYTSIAISYALQALYVADSVFCEESILTTMDIIMDGFGFMLAFGDLAWVPFMYSLQCRYLAEVPTAISPVYAALCLAVGVAGFYIFRAANMQKDTFKKNPNDASINRLRYIPTERGTRLLAGGWWGIARHINYFGDWLLSVGMSMPTGFATPLTYFYPVYFAVLLIHRDRRDDHNCGVKYGNSWKQYKRMVPYRIIPFVY